MSILDTENHMVIETSGEREAELRGELIAQRQSEIEKDLRQDFDDALLDFMEDHKDEAYQMLHNYLSADTLLNDEHLGDMRAFFDVYIEQIAAEQARGEFE